MKHFHYFRIVKIKSIDLSWTEQYIAIHIL